ncbi:hypothetical protein [Pseudomonas vancouverensis]|uniref:Poly(3-hydroxyalkanoate) polymerase subunit PhaE n=1 Tax=Pseudomonas vancouverensis TaxID=95300 RepID=A0A1H2NFT2_PSEVA|nr:hypothetical protein [Pseudomonas vancouverensis]KAB0489344.1 hypothetical protein F7R09_29235 [Pseudomonas vancouverensis]TDB60958.1 hypothetical protein EIY72_16590 [Pseudomonas vancouverensis]SDV04329.1 hypothetical protein SAMN05216558_2199 [Pseudomonas vancouverensis]
MALPDPFKLYRDAVTLFENGINGLAARHIDSKELGRVIDQYTRLTLGLQHLSQTSLAHLHKRMDLPSRAEVNALAVSLRRVEDKLDQLLPAPTALVSRPPRTRQAQAPALTTTLKPVAKRKRKGGNDNDTLA